MSNVYVGKQSYSAFFCVVATENDTTREKLNDKIICFALLFFQQRIIQS